MQIKKHLPLNLAVFVLAAAFWQAEAQAQTVEAKVTKRVVRHGPKRRGGVRDRKQLRFRSNTLMRQRARLYEPYIAAAAQKYGVDPRALWTLAYLETRFRPELVSPKKARGLMQFIPGTAARFNLKNPHDAVAAIDAAARYVRELTVRFDGRLDLVLASYNAGEGAVECYRSGRTLRTSSGRVINRRGIRTSGVPPYAETQSYVRRGLLVFSRVTSAGVFNPELISRIRRLQPSAMNISLAEQRTIDNELQGLGGVPATMLYARVSQKPAGMASVNQAVSKVKAVSGSEFETVFFDVNSGVRYFVMNGQIVKPVVTAGPEDEAAGSESGGSSETTSEHRVAKSFYISAGGE
jgi:hypothetical protein